MSKTEFVSPENRAKAYVFATFIFGILTVAYMTYGVFPSFDGVQSLSGEAPDDVVQFMGKEIVLAGLIFNTLISLILSMQVSEQSKEVWQKIWAELTRDEDAGSNL